MKRLLSLLVVASLVMVSFGCSQPASAPKSGTESGATGAGATEGSATEGGATEGAAEGGAAGESGGATE